MSEHWAEWSSEIRARSADLIIGIVEKDAKDWSPAGKGTFKCCSPLRADRSPSFYVYPDGGWHDFGLGEGGDLISYLQQRDKCSFREALDTIARHAGLPSWDEKKKTNGSADPAVVAKALEQAEDEHRVRAHTTAIVHLCHAALPSKVRAHLRDHYALTDEVIDFEKIGWVPQGLYELCQRVFAWEEAELLETGFFVKAGKGGVITAAQGQRILFPYWKDGFCHYTIGRAYHGYLKADEVTLADYDIGKYKKHLTRSDKFPYVSAHISNELLWGEDCLRTVKKSEPLPTAEGITDALTLKMLGFPVLSAVTTRISNRQIARTAAAARRASELVICNDNDIAEDGSEPGKKGALRMAEILWAEGIRVRIARLPRPDGTSKIDTNELVKAWLASGLTIDDCRVRYQKEILEPAEVLPEFLVTEMPADTAWTEIEKKLQTIGTLAGRMTPMQQAELFTKFSKRFPKVPKKHARIAFEQAAMTETRRLRDVGAPTPDGMARPQAPAVKIRGTVTMDFGSTEREMPNGVTERIATFSLELVRVVHAADGPNWLVCRVVGESNVTIMEEWTIPPRAWTGRREFVKLPHVRMQWTGGDDDVQGLQEFITRGLERVPHIRSTSVMGWHRLSGDEMRFVLPHGTLDKNGWMLAPDLVYLPNGGSSLQNKLPKERTPLDDRTLTLAREVFKTLPSMHETTPMIVLAAWFTASLFRLELQDKGHSGFMLCNVFGISGCGKTSLLTDLLWRVFGGVEHEEPLGAIQTVFVATKDLSSTNAIPLVFDEYKPIEMGAKNADIFRRNLKRSYANDSEARGRADQGLNTFTFHAPCLVAGETRLEDDQALLERTVYVPLSKHWLESNRDAQRAFCALIQKPLYHVAPLIWRWRLGVDVRDLMSQAASTCKAVLDAWPHQPPTRVRLTVTQCLFGLLALRSLYEHLSLPAPEMNYVAIVKWILIAILERDPAGETKLSARDAFDEMVIDAQEMAYLKEIREGQSFSWVGDNLFLYIPGIESAREIWKRNRGVINTSPGANALKRMATEKLISGGSYIVTAQHRMVMSRDDKESDVRGVLINPGKIPESFSCNSFPKTVVRKWGGGGRFGSGQGDMDN